MRMDPILCDLTRNNDGSLKLTLAEGKLPEVGTHERLRIALMPEGVTAIAEALPEAAQVQLDDNAKEIQALKLNMAVLAAALEKQGRKQGRPKAAKKK